MSSEKINVPQRRFKEFENDGVWEQRKLSDLCEKFTDGDWIEAKDQSAEGVRLIQTGNVGVTRYLDKSNNTKWISENTFDRLKCKEIFPGDILISRLPEPAGRACIMPDTGNKMITAVDCTIVRVKPDIDNKYLVQYLATNDYFSEVNTGLAGGTRQRISRSNLSEFLIPVPKNNLEQKRIGHLFENLDNLITFHQRKLEKIQAMKKSYLSEMFPAEGETKPKRRFSGFTDDWEQRKVGDIAEVVGGGTPNTNNPDYWEGDINWYAPAEISDQIYALESERKITELGLQKSSAKMLPAEKTILFTSRAGIGKMAILGYSACTNQGFQSLVLKDGYVPYFVYSMGKQLKEKAEAIASGSTFLEISGKMLADLNVMMPNNEEQMKIASYFQSLDNLITLHQRKLDKLKNMKQAYLAEMFV